MSKKSVIIRLIDIVLILLFGFLVVSEINKKSPVKLPQSDVKVKRDLDEEELMIVGIKEDTTLYLEGEDRAIASINELYGLIVLRNESFNRLNRKFRVRIRSEWNLPIKYTMRIANFCRNNNISVGMDIHNVGRGKK
jgi:biopolymer transport protein ExbD